MKVLRGLRFFFAFGWKSDKRYILYNVVAQICTCTLPLILAVLPKYILDELTQGKDLQRIAMYVLLLLGSTLLSTSVAHICRLKAFTLRIKVCYDFNLFMHKRLADADLVCMEDPGFLELKERANKFLYGDWNGFSSLLDSALDIVGQIITIGGIVCIVFTLNPWLVVLLVILVLVNAKVDAWAAENDVKLGAEQVTWERRWSYFGELFEDVQYGKEIRINDLSGWLLQHEVSFGKKVLEFYRRRNRFGMQSGLIGAGLTFVQQGIAYVYVVMGYLHGSISIGDFSMYISVMTTFSSAMRRLMKSVVDIKAFNVYFDAMDEYLHISNRMQASGSVLLKESPQIIEFRHVSYRYPGQEKYALRDISITIQAGEKLAIVGENGAGKTTFIKLLCRLYEPTEGEILLNGRNIMDYDQASYNAVLSAVFQDHRIFSLSLRDNVTLGREVSDEEIYAVLHKVGLSDFLRAHDNRLDTPLMRDFYEDGVIPSGGESQKITLARAILRNAPIVVLDEPAAALDPRSEHELYLRFNELTQSKMAVYISHRLSSTKFCDCIAVFQNGRIVEVGPHTVLYAQNGPYRELFDFQAQYYLSEEDTTKK